MTSRHDLQLVHAVSPSSKVTSDVYLGQLLVQLLVQLLKGPLWDSCSGRSGLFSGRCSGLCVFHSGPNGLLNRVFSVHILSLSPLGPLQKTQGPLQRPLHWPLRPLQRPWNSIGPCQICPKLFLSAAVMVV